MFSALSSLRNQRGSALAMIIIFTASLVIVGGALVTFSVNDKYMANYQEKDCKLYYITEAGLEAGVAMLGRYFHAYEDIEGELDGGSYSVELVGYPGLDVDHPYYAHLPTRISLLERIVISTGTLDGKTMVMAAILGMDNILTKALMVSDKLTVEDSNIYGNVHVNDSMHAKGINHIYGEFSYTNLSKIDFEAVGHQPCVTVHIEDDPDSPYEFVHRGELYDWMWAPQIPVPPVVFENFQRGGLDLELDGNRTWETFIYSSNIRRIKINGDLTIRPKKGQTFEFDGMLLVTGKVDIVGQQDAVIKLSGMIVSDRTLDVRGRINPHINNFEDNMLLLVARQNIDVTRVVIEDDKFEAGQIFMGGQLLLYSSEGNVTIAGSKHDPHFDYYGTIIASHTTIVKCNLRYVPDIFEQHGHHFGEGVVIKEWVKPRTIP